jgi:primosomal protein N' (replication factor Y) (superfamily II helicase)
MSKRLYEAIGHTLENNQQVLIFLNRRGTARQVLCSTCGWQATCTRCDIPLTYHADTHRFTCHTCGFSQPALSSCPTCKGTDILFKTVGTKAVASVLEKEFPSAGIRRFDTDNKKAENLENSYESLHTDSVDILVGTQVIGKGLDLPRLGLVGIIAADSSLYFPDFMAEERTYQLLKQVVGRVGRGHIEGRAIIQTYNPDNKTLQYIVSNDWEGFYEQQLEERCMFVFPPFCHLLKLACSRSSPESARSTADKLMADLKRHGLRLQLLGPSPSFYQKVNGRYRWQIIVKSKDRNEMLKIIPLLPSGWNYDLDPVNLL